MHDAAAIEWRPEPDDQERGGDQPRKKMPLGRRRTRYVQPYRRLLAGALTKSFSVALYPAISPAGLSPTRLRLPRYGSEYSANTTIAGNSISVPALTAFIGVRQNQSAVKTPSHVTERFRNRCS